jgi:hypothetical protein
VLVLNAVLGEGKRFIRPAELTAVAWAPVDPPALQPVASAR